MMIGSTICIPLLQSSLYYYNASIIPILLACRRPSRPSPWCTFGTYVGDDVVVKSAHSTEYPRNTTTTVKPRIPCATTERVTPWRRMQTSRSRDARRGIDLWIRRYEPEPVPYINSSEVLRQTTNRPNTSPMSESPRWQTRQPQAQSSLPRLQPDPSWPAGTYLSSTRSGS